jgi:hypothetical protein
MRKRMSKKKASLPPPVALEPLTPEQLERDRARRLARGIGCTAVMLRVYAGKHPRFKKSSQAQRSQK